MRQFVAGFIVGMIITVTTVAFYFVKKRSTAENQDNSQAKKLAELSKVTGGIAHEIKNPLSTIKVNLQLISEDLANPASKAGDFSRSIRKLAVVRKEADRLEQILNDFLRYADGMAPNLVSVDINNLIGDMVDFFTPQAYSHNVTIREGLSEEKLVCKIDENMLKQSVLNLFINAQQAMDKGGELIVRTYKRDNKAVIEITDTGCGIVADRLEHLFDTYYSSRRHGSGLGLATTKKIVELHKGSISVTSQIGKGTSFLIELPVCS
ncbi:MAG TPA: ATP-binding protein [Sedimentisphaerales bacterium]|nr:ATP-binding protein [Sedimentisphaerales bacterium]